MTVRYLKGKGILPEKEGQAPKHSLEDYSPYTQGRIQAARQALEYARKSKEFRPEELDMAKVNHRQAKENLARRLGDKQEAKRMPKAKQPQQEGLIKN